MELAAPKSVLIATGNKGKLRELESMLSKFPVVLRSLVEFSDLVEVDEAGSSFQENAILKARGYAAQAGLMTLADDSGLEVKCLDGAPGVLSARYAGDKASDAERVTKLLNEITQAKDSDRRARFVCAIAISDSNSNILATFEGICEGQIALTPRGVHGFGYDPVFIPVGYSESFGILSAGIKDKISHRGRALHAASFFFNKLFESNAV